MDVAGNGTQATAAIAGNRPQATCTTVARNGPSAIATSAGSDPIVPLGSEPYNEEPLAKGRKLYKGSSSKRPTADDEQDPHQNITIAQFVDQYMVMMDTLKNDAKKRGIFIKGEDKKRGGKEGGGKDC
ncbi:hypothetical protein RIF29_19762 [Crotalaria pallida]|uniref:Uncharacterized protein n=1 Tax=Crotalaria pallida TaxID=3830 RepID=A0AAN9I4F3_CROPI